mgnify:CR=1 FL=1
MGANETPAQEDDALTVRQDAINDSANIEIVADDARILAIARAIGRQIALEELKAARAANDNELAKSS